MTARPRTYVPGRLFSAAIVSLVLALLFLAPASAQTVDTFAIAYGDTVSNGVPGAGAGNIEVAGAQDAYTFSGAAGESAILDVLSGSLTTFHWTLSAPSGAVLYDGFYVDQQVTLTENGVHTITVSGFTGTSTGVYSFRLLLTPPPQNFAISIGDTVSDGVPVAGAGNLEAPGALDLYTFSGTAGQSVIFDVLSGSASQIGWRLNAPDGTALFDTVLGDRQQALTQTGTYTLTLRGNGIVSTGAYSLRLLLVPAPQNFAISIGDSVSDGVPAAGAGNLETAGALDLYTFSGTAGQSVIFDFLSGNAGQIGWRLNAPDGAVLFDTVLGDRQQALTQTGTYTLTLRGNAPASIGVYSFHLLLVPAPQNFAISIGDTVSDGAPAAGAGNLEAPGALDIYTFSGTAGQEVVFDYLSGNAGQIGWRLNAPDGTVLFDAILGDRQQALAQTGTYTLTLRGNAPASFGTYSLQLLPVPTSQNFAINIGDTVSDGVPAAGAGNLEAPGALDIYTFSGTAGQEVVFDYLSG
ncbi:MAG: hypothetical protein JNL42_23335, partial [Anaerolineae bacterium]|nr:hypothetical protein [Anaerolineae bacterium]